MAAFERLKHIWAAPRHRSNLDAMENAALERIERLLEALAVHAAGVDARLGSMEQRLDGMAQRLGALERGQDALRIELRERFESMDAQFRTLTSRMEHFEGRVTARLDRIEGKVANLEDQLENVIARLEHVEVAADGTNLRIDGLADDMKQRLRSMNERLSSAA